MRAKLIVIGIAALVLAALQPTQAQNRKVYRCEDAQGRVTYSDEMCRGGTELKNTDERSAEQRKAATDVVKREEDLADRLGRERRAAEKVKPAGPAHIPYSAAEQAAKEKPASKAAPKKKRAVEVADKTQV